MGTKTRIAGIILHVLIGGLMIFSGTYKLVATMPPEVIEQMTKVGLADKLVLLGVGEIIAAVLTIIPRTMSLGVLLASGFWGGVICFHLTHDGQIAMGIVMMILTWVGAFLRDKRQFASFLPSEG